MIKVEDYGLPMQAADSRYIDWGRLEMESGDSTGWDWHWPQIYAAGDCEMRKTFYRDYEVMVPMEFAEPVAVWDRDARKWEARGE